MTKGLRRAIIVFASAFLSVVTVYTFLEFSTIDETEKEVVEIYQDQLSAVLFSVNQYSQDIINSWIEELEILISTKSTNPEDQLDAFFANHPAIIVAFEASVELDTIEFVGRVSPGQKASIEQALRASQPLMAKLVQYLAGGYKKLEPIQDESGNTYLIFAGVEDGKTMIMGMQIDPVVFISEILSPRLQTIAREEIILSAISSTNDSIVYSTNRAFTENDELIISNESHLWLFPSYYLGVSFLDRTLNDLVRDRTRNSLVMLAVLNIVLIVGFVVIIRTVDKQMRLAKMKSDFVSNVSHEIRTPLALISMYAETLEMGRVRTDEERNKFYHVILSETRRLTELVNRILKFSKLEAGKQSYDFQVINLKTIIDEVMTSFDYHLQEGGYTLEVEQAEDLFIRADREAISTTVFNLLDNAIKYSGESKKIKLLTGNIGDHIYVKIIDEGMGIPKQDQKRIFEKFYRVEDPLIHNTKGSGLGLNLVYEIMKDHHGDVQVKSKLGQGSEFTLIFPIIKK